MNLVTGRFVGKFRKAAAPTVSQNTHSVARFPHPTQYITSTCHQCSALQPGSPVFDACSRQPSAKPSQTFQWRSGAKLPVTLFSGNLPVFYAYDTSKITVSYLYRMPVFVLWPATGSVIRNSVKC